MHILFCTWIGRGDEVIVPAQTHTATAHAVELAGAKPVLLIVIVAQEISIKIQEKFPKGRKQFVWFIF